MRLVLAALAGYGAAAAWVALVACQAPEEDGCSSAGSSVLYVLMVGTPLALVLVALVAVVLRGRDRR